MGLLSADQNEINEADRRGASVAIGEGPEQKAIRAAALQRLRGRGGGQESIGDGGLAEQQALDAASSGGFASPTNRAALVAAAFARTGEQGLGNAANEHAVQNTLAGEDWDLRQKNLVAAAKQREQNILQQKYEARRQMVKQLGQTALGVGLTIATGGLGAAPAAAIGAGGSMASAAYGRAQARKGRVNDYEDFQ